MKDEWLDDIVALATPWGQSALAVVRCSGPGVLSRLAAFFSKGERLTQSLGGEAFYGSLRDEKGHFVDELVAVVHRAPRSYTGQDTLDMMSHGSLQGIQRILELALRQGFRMAQPGEFTRRAFLHGKIDLSQVEAIDQLIHAQSPELYDQAAQHLEGRLFRFIEEQKRILLDIVALLNVQLDYAEDDIEESLDFPLERWQAVKKALRDLEESYDQQRLQREGLSLVFLGAPNAGKSSFFNALLRQDRSIVTPQAGTTRDYVEAHLSYKGVPLTLIDTAGLREGADLIEAEGIRRTHLRSTEADILFYLVDASKGWDVAEEQACNQLFVQAQKRGQKTFVLWNKIDLYPQVPSFAWGVHSMNPSGLESFWKILDTTLDIPESSQAFRLSLLSLRQRDLLRRALNRMHAFDEAFTLKRGIDILATELKGVLDALAEMTGELTHEDILDHMFAHFCLGK